MKERALFAALALLALVPFWAVAWVPTVDGPSHVYNAWIQAHLGDGGSGSYPALAEYFEIDRRPLPNWTAQAALRLLLAVLPPAAAEKVLVSGYAVLFLLAARYLAGAVDPGRSWLAWLAVPFALSVALHFGFYSFCISLALFLLTLGFWWRGRERPGLRFAVILNGLLLLCYFSHIVSSLLALLALGVLWLATLPSAVRAGALRRHLRHVAILLPQAVLPVWFLLAQRGAPVRGPREAFPTWSTLFLPRALFSFAGWPPRLILALVFLLLVLLTLRRRWLESRGTLRFRDEDAWPLLAVVLVAVYLLAPEKMAGGSLLKLRLTLYPWLALLPWLDPPPSPRFRRAAVAGLALLAAWSVATVLSAYRERDREVQAFLAAADGIAPDTRVVALVFGPTGAFREPLALFHAFDRAAVARGAVDLDDYEAASGAFPVRFRSSVFRPPTAAIAEAPESVDPRSLGGEIDYFYCWNVRPGSAVAQWLERRYRLVREEGAAQLYERRDRVRRARQGIEAP
jgi:hypothetical protein